MIINERKLTRQETSFLTASALCLTSIPFQTKIVSHIHNPIFAVWRWFHTCECLTTGKHLKRELFVINLEISSKATMKKSGAAFQTPKQTKATLAIQSEQNKDAKKNKNKRKSLPANLTNGDGDTSPKKPKIDAFSGTTDLFMQMNKSPEGKAVKKPGNEKSPGKQNKKAQNQNENAPKSEKALGERAKRRKERLIARRVAGKERLKETLGQVSTGDETAITQLKQHLTQLLQKQDLSKSGKRKVKQLKKALKAAGVDVSGFVMSQQDKEVKAATQKPQAANQKKQQKPSAGKKDSVAPGKKNLQQAQKKQIATKEEEEDSDEDEESDGTEDNVTALISALKKGEDESDEEEEDDSDADQDDSLMEAEAEEDESDEDEDDDDDEEEDSDENDEVPDKKTKLGKKNQSKLNQNKDTKALSMHHTNLKGRRINVQYSQGGKKKGEEKKKEIKAKNFKLQAMRQEGKLSGSVKQSQKRAARREKRKSANKTN